MAIGQEVQMTSPILRWGEKLPN